MKQHGQALTLPFLALLVLIFIIQDSMLSSVLALFWPSKYCLVPVKLFLRTRPPSVRISCY